MSIYNEFMLDNGGVRHFNWFSDQDP